MYGETKHSKISQYFLDNFPSINKFIEELKEVNGYIFLSQELNRIEAHLVLDVISAEFCQENPKAIVYTIHDNIATQIAYIDVLRAKAVEVFSRYLPKAPKFHIEYWCEECSDELKMVA
jgi:hypothetical protein